MPDGEDHVCSYVSNDVLKASLKDAGIKVASGTTRRQLYDKACDAGIVLPCCKDVKPSRGRHAQALKAGFLLKDDLLKRLRERIGDDDAVDLETMSKNRVVRLAQTLGIITREVAEASSTVRHTTLKTYLYTLVTDPEVRMRLKRYVNLYSMAWKRGMWLANLVANRLATEDSHDAVVWTRAPSPDSLAAPRLHEWLDKKSWVNQCFVPELDANGTRGSVHPVLAGVMSNDPTTFLRLGEGFQTLNRDAWGQVRSNMASSKFLPHVQTHVTTHLWSRIRRHVVSHHPLLDDCFGAIRSSLRPLAIGDDAWEDVLAWRKVVLKLSDENLEDEPSREPPQTFEFTERSLALHAWLYLHQPFVDGSAHSKKQAGGKDSCTRRFDLLPLSGGVGRVHSYVDVKIARCLLGKKGDDLRQLMDLTSDKVREAWENRRRRLRRAARENGRGVRSVDRWLKRGRGSVPADETSALRSFETDGVAMSLSYELKVIDNPHPFIGVVDKCRKGKEGSVVLPNPKDADRWPEGTPETKVLAACDLGRAKVITMAINRLPPMDRPMTDEQRTEWVSEASIFMLSRRLLRRGMKQHRQRAWQDRRIHERPGLRDAHQDMAESALRATAVSRHGFDGLKDRLEAMGRHWNVLKEEYLEGESADSYAKWRMVFFRGKRATIDRFIRRALRSQCPGSGDEPPTELSIGAAKFAATGKGEEAVPTSSLLREIIRVIRVHKMRVRLNKAVDEYLTTQVCYRCGERMTKASARLYRCTSPTCTCRPLCPCRRPGAALRYDMTSEMDDVIAKADGCSVYRLANEAGRRRNRDVNAARNMLMIGYAAVAGQERPMALRRDGPNAKLRKKSSGAGGVPKKRKKREGGDVSVTTPTRLAPNSENA